MNYQVVKQPMNSSGRHKYNVVDAGGKRADQFDTQAEAQVRADQMNAEYERVLAIL